MQKAALVAAALAVVSASGPRTLRDEERLFQDFQRTYGRKYSQLEEDRAFGCFRSNLDLIDRLNREDPEATHGTNQFTDICPEDFKKTYLTARPPASQLNAPILDVTGAAAGPKINWVEKGAVTPVWNQGQCGSSWAFCAVANIEGQWFLAGNNLTSLSTQEVVSCSGGGDMGCHGGEMDDAWKWMVSVGGLTTDAIYPYKSITGNTGKCDQAKVKEVKVPVVSYKNLPKDETKMADWLFANGPIAAAANAEYWMTYTGGIITKNCPSPPDHGVTIVGYDDTNAPPYWILKNTWGTSWGEKGYIRIEKGKDLCGITAQPGTGSVH